MKLLCDLQKLSILKNEAWYKCTTATFILDDVVKTLK